jgi:cytochrome c55X
VPTLLLALMTVLGLGSVPGRAVAGAVPAPVDEAALVHRVRQDCGSCHGMRLTGGLGPALTPQALAAWPVDNLVQVILHGRPGTPMPGWASMLSENDARWIAQRLLSGFPQDTRALP